MKFDNELPNTLSELLDLALVHENMAFNSDVYHVNMEDWHYLDPVNDTVCNVCLAGSVMAFGLGVPHGEDKGPSFFHEDTAKKLYALDLIRVGEVRQALFEFYSRERAKAIETLANDRMVNFIFYAYFEDGYDKDRDLWRHRMASISACLKRLGA